MHPRVQREKRILETMIHTYCREVHKASDLCVECEDLIEYAEKRLLSCPFLKDKPVCSKCDIHCYNTKQKDKIKAVMRKVGPKMILTHTFDTIWYYYYKFIHKSQKAS
ncbi:MAG: nitrous oxide-stimulated promoter family protein [Marinilabiliales bacterium]|mgnify:CR=1 FL=1|nr:MAG: nitrous oxide-stimulated promoter family protein [Marinilabiliales bacterium]